MGLNPYLLPRTKISVALLQPKLFPNTYDFVAFVIIVAIFILIIVGAEGMHQPLIKLETTPIELSLYKLPMYALYTTLRMFIAICASLLFTFIVATTAAKNRRAESLIIPALDILQSVPVLGFLTFVVPICMRIVPGNQIGLEIAAIFAIFTAQTWNMAFSLYQSLCTVPKNLKEVSAEFCLSKWQIFWRLEVPFAIPGLVWNTMMSMSSSWFFVVASEAISIGNTQFSLPGIGSWLALAIQSKDLSAVAWAAITMGIVILIYDQIVFRPIIVWADKFKMGQTSSLQQPKSWVYNIIKNTQFIYIFTKPLCVFACLLLSIRWSYFNSAFGKINILQQKRIWLDKIFNILWFLFIFVLLVGALLLIFNYLRKYISLSTLQDVFILGGITTLRVIILILLASLIWVPIGVWVGLRPKVVAWVRPLAQFLAAFPANLLFPLFVFVIVQYNLNPNIWLSILMILGTQWYIFFNVIAGITVFPYELKEVATIYRAGLWSWWCKVIFPGILPYYITGALAATGGAWNASIIAEVVSWGETRLAAKGLGAFIADATIAGDFPKVVLGVAVMAIFVVVFNKLCWHRLYVYAAKHTRLD
jgi:NitT/TauT family transport system permease protein